MRIKLAVACAGVLALALPLTAGAGSHDKVTGGGQVLLGSDGGAGNTIAFNAHDVERKNDNIGQVQYVDRSEGRGKDQDVRHGRVTCVEINGNTAVFAGLWRDGQAFQIFVEDNGSGAENTDMIVINKDADDDTCDEPEGDPDELARGNLTVHSGNGGNGE